MPPCLRKRAQGLRIGGLRRFVFFRVVRPRLLARVAKTANNPLYIDDEGFAVDSPDLNPIEQVFAKLKTLLRKSEERTVETV